MGLSYVCNRSRTTYNHKFSTSSPFCLFFFLFVSILSTWQEITLASSSRSIIFPVQIDNHPHTLCWLTEKLWAIAIEIISDLWSLVHNNYNYGHYIIPFWGCIVYLCLDVSFVYTYPSVLALSTVSLEWYTHRHRPTIDWFLFTFEPYYIIVHSGSVLFDFIASLVSQLPNSNPEHRPNSNDDNGDTDNYCFMFQWTYCVDCQ